jgi:methyl-accepting chemotaxis protein
MNRYIANALGLTAIAALAAFAWALVQWSQAGAAVTVSAAHLDSVLTQADVAMRTINRGCAPGPCGTLAEVDKAVVHLSDITVAVQKQANDSGKLMQHASATLDGMAFDAQNELDDLKATTTATTGLVEDGRQVMVQVNTDLRTLNDSLEAVKPVIDHADAVVDHVDVAVNSMTPDAQRLMKNSADGMGELAGIAGDGHKMTTHLERDFDAKQAWWKKAFPMAEDAGKFYTCIATHVCMN